MGWLRRVLLCVTVVVAWTASDVAVSHAQDDDSKTKKEARKLLTDGDRALRKGEALRSRGREEKALEEFRTSLAAYKRAYEVLPEPQIYFAIGTAEERLGMYLDAYGHYRRLLEEAEEVGDRLRAAVEQRIEEVLLQLAVVRVTIEPEGATVFVDEREIGLAPLAEPLILEPGPHRISVRKDGFTPGSDQLQVAPGDKLERTIALKEIPKVVEAKPEPPPPPRPLGPPPGRSILVTSLVVTGVLAIASTSTGVIALAKHGTYSDESLTVAERQQAGDKGKTYALSSDVLLGATAVAAGFTAYYYYGVYRPRAERRLEENRRQAWVSPFVSGSGAGVALGGRF